MFTMKYGMIIKVPRNHFTYLGVELYFPEIGEQPYRGKLRNFAFRIKQYKTNRLLVASDIEAYVNAAVVVRASVLSMKKKMPPLHDFSLFSNACRGSFFSARKPGTRSADSGGPPLRSDENIAARHATFVQDNTGANKNNNAPPRSVTRAVQLPEIIREYMSPREQRSVRMFFSLAMICLGTSRRIHESSGTKLRTPTSDVFNDAWTKYDWNELRM